MPYHHWQLLQKLQQLPLMARRIKLIIIIWTPSSRLAIGSIQKLPRISALRGGMTPYPLVCCSKQLSVRTVVFIFLVFAGGIVSSVAKTAKIKT